MFVLAHGVDDRHFVLLGECLHFRDRAVGANDERVQETTQDAGRIAGLVHFALGLPILAAFLIYFQRPLNLTEFAWFPMIVLVQLVLTLGCALILSALTVHFRDLKDILSNLMTFWFFATPIIYPYFMIKVPWQTTLLQLNPFTHLAISYQEVLFFEGPFGHLFWLLVLGLLSALLFLVGYFMFDRMRDTFAEEV